MVGCFNSQTQRYESCSSQLPTYIAVAVLVPLSGVLISALVYLYIRFRRRQMMRRQQQMYMSTIVPVYNTIQGEQPIPYTFSYPPGYPTDAPRESFDKLPTYEQIIQATPVANNTNIDNSGPATIPVNTVSQGLTNPMKTQT